MIKKDYIFFAVVLILLVIVIILEYDSTKKWVEYKKTHKCIAAYNNPANIVPAYNVTNGAIMILMQPGQTVYTCDNGIVAR